MVSQKTRCQIVLLIVLSFGIGGLILRAQVPLEVGRRDWASTLPDGEGKGLVLGTCTQCHSLSPIVLQRKTAVKWERLVDDMIARGAQIRVDEIAPITAYLARSFGPDSAPLTIRNEPHAAVAADLTLQNTATALPEGAGRAIVLNSCTTCHVLSKTTDARKDEAGWRVSVKDMVRLGATLRPEEEKVLVDYLVKNFKPRPSTVSAKAEPEQSSVGMTSGINGMARANTSANPASRLPDDEGKALILATCVQCHASLVYITGLRKSPEGWRHSVNDMISRGAQVTPQEAEIIIGYLSKHMAQGKKAE